MIISTPLVGVGRRNLDFGKGFYVTDIMEQAVSWASRPANMGKPQIVNVYNFDIDQLHQSQFNLKKFDAYDADWLEFIAACRAGNEVWKEFDVIEGGIANDRVFNTIELYLQGLILQNEALQRLNLEKPNNQICILNQVVADTLLQFTDCILIENHGNK